MKLNFYQNKLITSFIKDFNLNRFQETNNDNLSSLAILIYKWNCYFRINFFYILFNNSILITNLSYYLMNISLYRNKTYN